MLSPVSLKRVLVVLPKHRFGAPWSPVIGLTFQVNGSTGSQILALNDSGNVIQFYAAGLVE